MKTTIRHIAATLFTIAALVPTAFAGPKYTPQFSNGTKAQAVAPQPATAESCKMDHGNKDMKCCSNKIVSTAPLRRSGHMHTKKVHTCSM